MVAPDHRGKMRDNSYYPQSRQGCPIVVSLDEYAAARSRRDSARARVVALSDKLRYLADRLQHPEDVRTNAQTLMRVGRDFPYVLDEPDVPTWPEIADAIRAFISAEDDYLMADSSLSPDQRRYLEAG